MKNKILRVFALVAAITAIAAFSSGCGNSSGSGGDGGSVGSIVVETTGDGRKIVREIGVDIDADKGKTSDATSGILALLASAGGSVTDRYTSDYSSYSYVRLTLKIPSDKVDSFVSSLKDSYNVVSSREKTTDVTEKYNAYKTQLTGLKQKKTIYDGLYADEKATVADKLVILDKLEELNKAIGQAEEQTFSVRRSRILRNRQRLYIDAGVGRRGNRAHGYFRSGNPDCARRRAYSRGRKTFGREEKT